MLNVDKKQYLFFHHFVNSLYIPCIRRQLAVACLLSITVSSSMFRTVLKL